jgi:hypothetical protein
MEKAQNNLCAICGNPQHQFHKGTRKRLYVDHDHKTNKVRGLLCNNCNAGVGRFKDEPDRLRSAADYLERHNNATKRH